MSEVENKFPNHDNYITTPEFNRLTAENFTAWLTQANLVNKTDFDNNKLININKKITSNKTKYVEAEKNSWYNKQSCANIRTGIWFLLGRMYFTGNDGYQNFQVFASMLISLILDSNKEVCHMTKMNYNKVILNRSCLIQLIAEKT